MNTLNACHASHVTLLDRRRQSSHRILQIQIHQVSDPTRGDLAVAAISNEIHRRNQIQSDFDVQHATTCFQSATM